VSPEIGDGALFVDGELKARAIIDRMQCFLPELRKESCVVLGCSVESYGKVWEWLQKHFKTKEEEKYVAIVGTAEPIMLLRCRIVEQIPGAAVRQYKIFSRAE
tara:strand:- start:1225 stop:1533 length:309 start_codon:yes stop_codon:yes gene_type:complete